MTKSTIASTNLTANRMLKPLSLAISSVILVACSSTGTNTKPSSQPTRTVPQPVTVQQGGTGIGVLNAEMLDTLENLLQATDMSMVEGDELAIQRYGNLWDRIRRGYRMNDITNARIEAQKSWFYTRQSYLDRLTARASRYLHHTVAEAERRGIPSELALLPIIESSYDPSATSNAAAAGLWQFIPSTGRIYGLNQSASYDGRRDVIESTRAAYDFLTSLYNQFGSWELALAAYNAGPGRVSRAIRANQEQGLPTDYWSLKLPTETMNYVPRFLAVAQIVKAPNSYGIHLPAIANHNHFRTVPVNYGVNLSEVASITGVAVDELRLLNPALLNQTVDEIGPNRIVIPDSLPSQMDAQLSALKGYGFGGDYIATAPAQSISYVVPKSGAAANNSSQQELIATNTLPTTIAQVTPAGTIVQEPPLSAAEKDLIVQQIRSSTPEPVQAINPNDGNIQLNAVQTSQSVLDARGETKTLSFAGAPARNPAPATTAQPTVVQTLPEPAPVVTEPVSPVSVPVTPTTAPEPVQAQTPRPQPQPTPKPTPKPESYTVRAGDSLTSVAAANGLSVGQLASYNNLANDAHIRVGQRLWLVAGKVTPQPTRQTQPSTPARQSSSSSTATHKVQAGESLTAIARKYNVTLQALAAENDLSVTDGVFIGQTLKLPNGAQAVTTSASAPTQSSPRSSSQSSANLGATENYTVKSGESLTQLANRFGVSIADLAAANNLASNANLRIGQVIKVPKLTTTYTVKSGDGLISLARRFGISTDELAKMNNLEPNANLRIGQVLTVPNK